MSNSDSKFNSKLALIPIVGWIGGIKHLVHDYTPEHKTAISQYKYNVSQTISRQRNNSKDELHSNKRKFMENVRYIYNLCNGNYNKIIENKNQFLSILKEFKEKLCNICH